MMRMKTLVLVGIVASGLFCLPIPSSALESGDHLAEQALEECHRGRLAVDRATRLAHFQQGQIMGERAVAEDEGSADAHFALFCNLGELLRVDGESLASLFGLRRMMNELDRALELDPAHIDALSAKGTLLVKLPSLLGGDAEKGEALLEQVVSRAPKAVNARLSLAKVRCEHGRHQEAVTLASDALTLAQQHNRADFIPEARAVLEQLQANAAKATYKAHF
jgi:tetratricopeptide (TPR) repeat protein